MRRTAILLAAAAAVTVGLVGTFIALPSDGAAAEDAEAAGPVATARVVRRSIQSVDVLDGTLGYTGAYPVVNRLATAEAAAGGSGSSTPDQAYLAARAQYDTAVANRDALKKPSAADIERAQATLAQARAAYATAQQAFGGPTKAQAASAKAAVTQAEEALAAARAQRDAARAALDACEAALAAAGDPSSPDPTCDPDTLRAALDRATGDVRTRTAQRDAARAAFNGLDDVPANASASLRSASAAVSAAEAALDALRHPTAAKVRAADDAVASAKAALDATAEARGLPGGTVTSLPEPGAVVNVGGVLYAVDGTHLVTLLEGELPAWRDLEPGIADGPDVRQLERSLDALGFGFDGVAPDDHWDEDTTAAVEVFQASTGAPVTGSLDLGRIVFLPGDARVAEVLVDLGATVRDESRVLAVTSTQREVVVDLEADRQGIVSVGMPVSVDLPDGTRTTGTVTAIGTVATATGGANAADAAPTVPVTISLDDPGATGSLDGAPVQVNVVRERRDDVLAAPVGALLALAEGGYAVEVAGADGSTRLVAVEIGLFEDGFVEVRSSELTEGTTVVVPQ